MENKVNEARKQIAVLAAVMASTSGSGMMLMHGHSRAFWVWMGAELAVLSMLVVKMVRLRMMGAFASGECDAEDEQGT